MWMLYVITLLPEIQDAKYTHYETFKDEMTCIVAEANLQDELKNGELTQCVFNKKIVKKNSV